MSAQRKVGKEVSKRLFPEYIYITLLVCRGVEEDENELTVALRLKMQSALYFPRLKIAHEAEELAGQVG